MINKLITLVKIRLKNWSVYRFDVVSSIFGIVIPIVGLSLYWIYTLNNGSGGIESIFFSSETIIVYYIIVFVMELLYSYEIAFSVEEDIATGRMNGYLILPCKYMIIKLSEYLATNILYIVILIVILAIMNLLSVVKITPQVLCVFIIMLFLAMVFHFLFLMTVGIVTIWLKNINNMIYFLESLSSLIAGTVVPLSLFPNGFKWILWNPFSLSIYVPSEMLLTGEISLTKILVLGAWCVLAYIVYEICWSKAIHSYQAYGG